MKILKLIKVLFQLFLLLYISFIINVDVYETVSFGKLAFAFDR